MNVKDEKKILLTLYKFLIVITFFLFILLNITELMTSIYIIEIIVCVWLFDTFSFLGGKIIGGKKLIPSISSGKTQSGLLVGIITTLLIMCTYSILIKSFSSAYFLFILVIILFAFLGDLLASKVKRLSSIKDSGSIMPGHGGLLDRLDSFLGVFFFISIFKMLP